MTSDIVERLRKIGRRYYDPVAAFTVDPTCNEAAAEIESLRSRLADLEAERAIIIQRAENAEAALEEADERHGRYIKAVGELAGMAARLAGAEALLREMRDDTDDRVSPGFRSAINAYLSRKGESHE